MCLIGTHAERLRPQALLDQSRGPQLSAADVLTHQDRVDGAAQLLAIERPHVVDVEDADVLIPLGLCGGARLIPEVANEAAVAWRITGEGPRLLVEDQLTATRPVRVDGGPRALDADQRRVEAPERRVRLTDGLVRAHRGHSTHAEAAAKLGSQLLQLTRQQLEQVLAVFALSQCPGRGKLHQRLDSIGSDVPSVLDPSLVGVDLLEA